MRFADIRVTQGQKYRCLKKAAQFLFPKVPHAPNCGETVSQLPAFPVLPVDSVHGIWTHVTIYLFGQLILKALRTISFDFILTEVKCFKKYLFISLAVVGSPLWHAGSSGFTVACGSMRDLQLLMWDQVPCLEVEPRPPALGEWSLSHWTTRGSPRTFAV